MIFIVVLHSLGHGGLLSNTLTNSPQYKVAWMLEIMAFCAVDIFALISGYVSINKKETQQNNSKYFMLWFQVVFYGLIITFIFNLIKPNLVTSKDYLISLFPISNNLYWYFTAYTGLMIIKPLLDKAINNINEKTLRKMFILIILVFSVFGTMRQRFELINGYSFIWITLLYILGCIIKKCEIGKRIKPYQAALGILILYVATYLYKMYGIDITSPNILTKDMIVSYTSITVLGSAILYVVFYSKRTFNHKAQKIITFLSSSSFAIYLLNDHNLIRNYCIKDRFTYLWNQSPIKIILEIIVFAILFSGGGILLDKVRQFLFKKCHIQKLAQKIESVLNKILTKISDLI